MWSLSFTRNYLFNFLDSIPQDQEKALIIIIINSHTDHSPELVERNQQTLQRLKSQFTLICDISSYKASLHQHHLSHLLVIDKNRLPAKHGVGLARKIGADLALQLIVDNKLKSHWIHNTDADVVLPHDYFQQHTELDDKIAAAIYPFKHHYADDPTLAKAMSGKKNATAPMSKPCKVSVTLTAQKPPMRV